MQACFRDVNGPITLPSLYNVHPHVPTKYIVKIGSAEV